MVTVKRKIKSVNEWMRIIIRVGGGYRAAQFLYDVDVREQVEERCLMIVVGFDRYTAGY